MRLLTTSNGDLPYVKVILNQDDTISYESNVANVSIQAEIRQRAMTNDDLKILLNEVYTLHEYNVEDEPVKRGWNNALIQASWRIMGFFGRAQ